MPDTRFPISGNVRVWWAGPNGLARPAAPTVAELNAAIDISDAISWNDKDFGVQASSTTNDPAITAKGNVQNRGAAQYGGSLSFYYPGAHNDNSNLYSVVFDALRLPDTQGYIITRVDGVELAQPTGTTSNPGTKAAAGDLVSVYRVATGGYAEAITGEEAFRYTISFLPRGEVYVNAIVRTAATPTPPVLGGPATATIAGGKIALTATQVNRDVTRAVRWSTTTPLIASISQAGIVTPLTAGAASFIATDLATNTPSTAKAVTIT